MKKINRKLKRPNTSSKLILEEVIGLTTKNGNGLCSSNSKCVYIAGCAAVVYDVDSDAQSHLIVSNRMPKPLSCVAVSHDRGFIAAGESGHQPAVVVWDLATLAVGAELKGHQYGVACMAFSPDGKHLASVGFPHDGYLCLWHWRSGMLVTKLKASSCSAVASVSFSSDAKFIITAGRKHLKFWTVGHANTRAGSLVMHGKPVNLGHHKGCSFIAVTSPPSTESGLVDCQQAGVFSPIYALTDSGVLCLLHSGLSIRNSVNLKVEKAYALSASNKLVACACNNGVVKLFTVDFLSYAGSLQYPEAKGCKKANDMDSLAKISENECQPFPSLPDAIACQFLTLDKLVVVYGDHSLNIWNIHNVCKASTCCVLVSHSACIWDIKNLPCGNMHDASLVCAAIGCSGGVSFATCSADCTIRIWDLTLQPIFSEDNSTPATDNNFETTEQVGTTCLVSAGVFERDSVVSGVSTQGFRAMAVSSDGKHLAAGDCQGNLHVYNLHSFDFTCIQGAHDGEILSLSFSMPCKDVLSNEVLESQYFLASGGRDRMIHLYDVERDFNLIGSVDDHSAAVTSVKLTCNGSKILSCGADKSLVFRDVAITDSNCKISRCHHQTVTHGIVHDMAADPMVEVAVTVGQDKKINTFDIAAGKLIRSFKQNSDYGDPLKVAMDPSCSFLVCSYTNRSICIYDFITGEMVAQALGHGEAITGVIFLPDCKHVVSVDGDGCIFVWKVPASLSLRMLLRVKQNSCPFSPKNMTQPVALSKIKFLEEDGHQWKIKHKGVAVAENSNQFSQRGLCQVGVQQETSAFKFSISRLPKWAQAEVTIPDFIPKDPESTSSQRVGRQVISPSVDNEGGNAPACPVLQTPSKHDVEGSEQFPGSMFRISCGTDNSQGSSMRQQNHSNFALDRRWFTIHTVCLDLLNSPEAWDMKDMKVPMFVSNLSQISGMKTTSNIMQIELSSRNPSVNNSSVEPAFQISNHVNREGSTLNIRTKLNTFGSLSKRNNNQGITKLRTYHKEIGPDVSEQLQSETTDSGLQAAMDINATSNLNVGNLSEKLKTEGRPSSARRSYSGRFVVRQDLFRGQKKLLDTPIQEFGCGTMNRDKGTAPNVIVKDPYPFMQMPEESRTTDTCKQDLKNLTRSSMRPSCIISKNGSLGFSATDKSANAQATKFGDQEEHGFGEINNNETIVACKEALLNLDAAAESAFHLFSKLGRMPSGDEEISRQPEAQLFAEATQMLTSIAKKVHAIATLVHPTNNNACRRTEVDDVPSFEPLLGTFAESLSQRVVEILKKNGSSL